MSVTAPAVDLREPKWEDRSRIEGIVRATELFREEEVGIALEVFDGSVAAPGVAAPGVAAHSSARLPCARLPDYASIAAYDADLLVGWVAFGQRPCTDGTFDCYWIVVDPARQGTGVGTMLIEAMEGRLAGRARLIVAETSGRDDYAPTRAFYQRTGYRPLSRIPDFYSAGDDLVVFVKYLSPAVRL